MEVEKKKVQETKRGPGGRFVKLVESANDGLEAGAPSPRVKDCGRFAKKELAAAWPVIVETLVSRAKKGSYNHTKLAVEVLGLKEEAGKVRGRKKEFSLAKLLENELEKSKAGRVAGDGAATARTPADSSASLRNDNEGAGKGRTAAR
ncbi:MAG: hypothetical protein ACYCSN_05525 [Acidobacteriaceae bacterium]